MHVAGLLALWPLHTLRNAVRLVHHAAVFRILNPALHAAVLHAPIASGGALAVDTGEVDVRERLPRVRSNGHRSGKVYGIGVGIQAHEVSLNQHLERDKLWIVDLEKRPSH